MADAPADPAAPTIHSGGVPAPAASDSSTGLSLSGRARRSSKGPPLTDALDQELTRHGVLLVDTAVLRRIIKEHRKLEGAGVQVPHDHWYTLAREELNGLAEASSIERGDGTGTAQVVLVPALRQQLATGEVPAFLQLWRALFHSRLHHTLDALALDDAAVQERLAALGRAEVAEARTVLEEENLLLPPLDGRGTDAPDGPRTAVDDLSAYIELVALYCELRAFAPDALAVTFPALSERAAEVDAVIRRDLDPDALLAAVRPAGAPAQAYTAPVEPLLDASTDRLEFTDPSARKAAGKARAKGNLSRAAILSARAGDHPTAKLDLDELVKRLATALAATPTDTRGWSDALAPVAFIAATQASLRFNANVRLLHDVQSACVVSERETKVVDVMEWALSLGKQPIVRALPATRVVRVAKHLHAAAAKLAKCELATAEQRDQLAAVLHAMTKRADDNVRSELRAKVEHALDEVALHPHSVPERVAEKTLVDELLDRAVSVGRLALGDLRDTLSHNDLKMHDLESRELQRGDQLLRCDRELDRTLDGVYRRGEAYLRFLQKVSSIMFGTPVGRFFTLYLILPFLGAFATLEGLQHTVGTLSHKLLHYEPEFAPKLNVAIGAVFLFLLLYVPPFRAVVWKAVQILWRAVRWIAWDVPSAVWNFPLVKQLRASIVGQWIVKPGIWGGLALLIAHRSPYRWFIGAGVFLLVALVTNSKWGRVFEERTLDWALRGGRHLRTRVIPAFLKYVLELFGRWLDLLDRGIYRVDEALRFRTGQSRVMIVVKGFLGTIWFVITYILRLYVDLFIEPTVNPVKHFPVVTVAAKLMIPFIPSILSGVASAASQVFGPAIGGGFAGFTVLVIPGFAGFLVWEFKENWKLYRATRPKTLRPFAIGSHGETMTAFLRPGFHSGTLPKTFARLRRATMRADERAIAKQEEALHHVEEAIARFANRQLVSMLAEVAAFRATDLALVGVAVTSNRVQLGLACPSVGPTVTTIRFELDDTYLVASIPEPGWLAQLDDDQREIFEVALLGLYKLSAVDLVLEQVMHARDAAEAAAEPLPVDLSDRTLAALARRRAVFAREPLFWTVWSTTWQHIARNEPPGTVMAGPSALPA